tara:strand:+ start:2273 stop:2815 length:543 start_codon:yes stop_codon:yes gene_type:complete
MNESGTNNTHQSLEAAPQDDSVNAFVNGFVTLLDEGPWAFDPKVAVGLMVGTPLLLLAMCIMCLVCRGVPSTPCGGRCTYWKRMPKDVGGLEPDMAIGEHQDEHCDEDSVDEEPRAEHPAPADDGDDTDCDDTGIGGQRECCSKMAAVLESGGLETASEASQPKTKQANGKKKVRVVVAP